MQFIKIKDDEGADVILNPVFIRNMRIAKKRVLGHYRDGEMFKIDIKPGEAVELIDTDLLNGYFKRV